MNIFRAYDGELDEYLQRGKHLDRIRYEPNNQEGIALYEIVVDDKTGERELREIYEDYDLPNEHLLNKGTDAENIKLIIVEKESSEHKKKTKKHSHKDKKKSKKDKKDKKKSHKDKKDKKRSHKDKKKSKKESDKDKK
jgi:hypothetical protein